MGYNYYDDIKSIINASKEIYELADKYIEDLDISKMDYSDIDRITYLAEKIGLTCRAKAPSVDYEYIDYEPYSLQYPYPVTVEIKDKSLVLKTPLTFRRMYQNKSLKANYVIANYVHSALTEFVKDNNINAYEFFDFPVTMTIVRKKVKFKRSICDNDNLENQRIVNEFMNTLGMNDSALMMDCYYCFRECKDKNEEGMEFILSSNLDFFKTKQ